MKQRMKESHERAASAGEDRSADRAASRLAVTVEPRRQRRDHAHHPLALLGFRLVDYAAPDRALNGLDSDTVYLNTGPPVRPT